MKLYSTMLSLVLAVIPAAPAVAAEASDKQDKEVSYLNAITFDSRDLAKNGKEVCLSMDITLDSARIRTQHSISLTPVLVSADGKKEQPFETIIIDGRTRHKVSLRQDRLDRPDMERASAQAVIKRKNRSRQEYSYVSTLPYGRWMLDGSVIIRETVTGCASCGKGESEEVLDSPVLPTFVPKWETGRIEPEAEPVKYREENRIARLQFAQSKYDIRPSLADNRAVLDTVTRSIDLVKGKEYISIRGIYVAGYASPEGTYEYNMTLSNNRASAFADYISEHNGIDPDLVSVEWSGEDWNGFREQLGKSSFEKKDIVIDIIDEYTQDRNECEKVMRDAITWGEYRWLVDNIYPYLRHCMYRIEYQVRGFSAEEALQIIRERPQDLGLKEIFAVAEHYGPGTEGYDHAMEVAERYYPDAPAVRCAQALRALDEGDPVAVVAILRGTSDPVLQNILGVAYSQAGQYDTARDAFTAASGSGDSSARHNLAQLDALLDQMSE